MHLVEDVGGICATPPSLRGAAEVQATTAARAAELHPSIFAWNLADEVAGNGHSPAEVHYVRSVAAWLHAHDPTRIVAVDVWGSHPPKVAGTPDSPGDADAATGQTGRDKQPAGAPADPRDP